jgi:alpha-L-fucosidase
MKKVLLMFLFIHSIGTIGFGQEEKMQWFADAKLGIFIHWGIYAVNGTDESWAFYNKKMSHSDYMEQIKGFSAGQYDPSEWVDLIKKSGARYTVLTSKHHDGVALWSTQANHWSIPKHSPAGKDVLSPFSAAVKEAGLKLGIYYSILDWSHPDYTGFTKDSSRYVIKDNTERWGKFVEFNKIQLQELMTQQNPDLWWFDGGWEHSAEEWQAPMLGKMLRDHNPNVIINARLNGEGDYDTPEQNFPIQRPDEKYWELCLTTNNNWGYQHNDKNWKTPEEIIAIYTDVVCNGGNLLLDIGPMETGQIPKEQVAILEALGDWNRKNGEAIFGTVAGLPLGHYYGGSTYSKDSTCIYLFLNGNESGPIQVKGLMNKVLEAEFLSRGEAVKTKIVGKISWSQKPGLLFLSWGPKRKLRKQTIPVIKLKLDGAVRLYQGKGGL